MIKKILLSSFLFFSLHSFAQEGTASPYSFYGVGEIKFKGHSALNVDSFNFSIGFNKRVQSNVIIIDFAKNLETYITFI